MIDYCKIVQQVFAGSPTSLFFMVLENIEKTTHWKRRVMGNAAALSDFDLTGGKSDLFSILLCELCARPREYSNSWFDPT